MFKNVEKTSGGGNWSGNKLAGKNVEGEKIQVNKEPGAEGDG